jgi:hypothetical protein
LATCQVIFSKLLHDGLFVRQTDPIFFVVWQDHPRGEAGEE